MDFRNQCRTCLNDSKEMRHIDTVILISGQEVRLSDILQEIYNYEVVRDVCYPQNICINCVHQLTITYSFKNLIEKNAQTLKDCIEFKANVNSDKYSDYEFDTEDEIPIKANCDEVIKNEKPKYIKKIIVNQQAAGPSTLFCVQCKGEFNSVRMLNEHCVKNHPAKSIIGRDCEYCNEKFDDFRTLVLHRKLHSTPYLCENCWKGFFELQELQTHSCQPSRHKEKNKSSEKTLRQCDQCGKSYPPGYINIHMMTHSNDRRYCCKYCPKKFKVPGGLHSHILWNHKRTRNHKCEVCNATFISSSSKSSHIRKNHLKEKKYGCDSCEKRFFSKSELQRHSLTHTGAKNFHCHLCEKSYQTRYGLNVHLKSHSLCQM